jgi:vacuolar-type H+-ATPase subunit F/Vma7
MSGTLLAVVPAEVEAGFRLAGVETVTANSDEEAATVVGRVLEEGMEGVVAVYEAFYESLPPGLAEQSRASLSPVVIALPAGLHQMSGETRRARLADLLTRAVGYQVTFGAREQR